MTRNTRLNEKYSVTDRQDFIMAFAPGENFESISIYNHLT